MRTPRFLVALGVLALLESGASARADEYEMDAAHSGVTFKISHLGISHIYGRFNEFSGGFTLENGDPTKASFKLDIKSQSIDTNNAGRDRHLRSGDFFNVKQFPSISFTSTSVKAIEGGYEVAGDLKMHGTTKAVAFTLKGGQTAEFPPGVQRTGYSTELVLKRTDFGVGRPTPALGDDVLISISFEATKKK